MSGPAPTRRRRDRRRSPARQRGIALLVAILLVALGTIIAADIAYRSAMSARRATATLSFDEALLVAEAAEALSAYGLRTVLSNSRTSANSGTSNAGAAGGAANVTANQAWAQPIPPIEVVPGVTLEAQLEDLQGRFNLNWLVTSATGQQAGVPNTGTNNTTNQGLGGSTTGMGNSTGAQGALGTGAGQPDPQAVAAFRKLLEEVQVDPKWVDMVVDWIDKDNQPQTQGAEDSAYMGQNPPYLAANQYITSTSELLALPGFGRENYDKIAPFIAALPPSTTLNICTAKAAVLNAFNPTENTYTDDMLQKSRQSAPGCFPDQGTFSATFGSQTGTSFNASRFTQTSSYFRLSSVVTIGSAEFNLYSLLYLDGQYFVHPIQRSFSPD